MYPYFSANSIDITVILEHAIRDLAEEEVLTSLVHLVDDECLDCAFEAGGHVDGLLKDLTVVMFVKRAVVVQFTKILYALFHYTINGIVGGVGVVSHPSL